MKADFSCFFVIINLKSIFGRKMKRKKQQRDSLSPCMPRCSHFNLFIKSLYSLYI